MHAGSRWGHAYKWWEASLPRKVQGMHTYEMNACFFWCHLKHQRAVRYSNKLTAPVVSPLMFPAANGSVSPVTAFFLLKSFCFLKSSASCSSTFGLDGSPLMTSVWPLLPTKNLLLVNNHIDLRWLPIGLQYCTPNCLNFLLPFLIQSKCFYFSRQKIC